jgi:protein involved in polysaccharide export with SLBB domain
MIALLADKTALLREKAVARLVKEKLFLQGGDYTSHKQPQMEEKLSVGDKVEEFL